jgi:multiple sugar transport system substrate-binding protein/arabinosaccharide transport system substrate-binding protein
VYYYREDLLQKLKIDPASLETWDDVLAAGARTAANGVALGVVATGGDPGAVLTHYAILMQQRGGSFFDVSGDLALDSRESVDALTVLVDGLKSGAFIGLSDFFGGPGTAVLKQGKTAGYFMPDWFNVFILAPSVPEQSGMWRIGGLPRFEGGGSRTSVMGGTGFAVSKGKDTTEAAYDLLSKTYMTQEGQLQRFKQLRYLPTMKSVWEDPEFLSYSDEFLGGQETSALYAELVAEAPAQNQSIHWSVMQTELSKQLIDAYNGKTSPAQAIKNAVTAIEAQIR